MVLPEGYSPGKRAVLIGAVVWLTVIGIGFASLWRYAYTPGRDADTSPVWPSRTSLQHDPHRPTLVLIVSPGCPCSQATIRELARIVARAPGKAAALRLIFDAQTGDGRPPQESRLWGMAQEIPGAVSVMDGDGREAAAFGAHVSGQAFLYDAAGRLRFSGGVTAARGHGGDNDGAESVVALLATGTSPVEHTPVFGCALKERP